MPFWSMIDYAGLAVSGEDMFIDYWDGIQTQDIFRCQDYIHGH